MAKSSHAEGKQVGKLVCQAALEKIKMHRGPASDHGFAFLPFSVDLCGIVHHDGSTIIITDNVLWLTIT